MLLRVLWLLLLLGACARDAKPVPLVPAAPPVEAVQVSARVPTTSEELTFTAGGRSIPATVVAPTARGPWPAVLLLAGSGPTDRDWNSPLMATKNGSGKLLAERLAAHGAVVLRFDKAGSGDNPGPPLAEWTIDTYRDEARAALELLRARADVRADRVFVAGHSEGGLHATRLALAAPSEIAGVLYLASASRSMAETMLTQLEHQLKHPMAMLSEEQIAAEMASLRAAMTEILAGRPVEPEKASKIPQLQRLIASLAAPAAAPLTAGLLGFDNSVEATKITVPALVVSGGKDVQVDPDLDTSRLAAALRAAGRDVTFHIAPDADHVLKHEPKSVAQLRANLAAVTNGYNADDRVIDDELARTIVEWLAARTRTDER